MVKLAVVSQGEVLVGARARRVEASRVVASRSLVHARAIRTLRCSMGEPRAIAWTVVTSPTARANPRRRHGKRLVFRFEVFARHRDVAVRTHVGNVIRFDLSRGALISSGFSSASS